MRETFINVTQNKLAGTGVAVVFAILFPLFGNHANLRERMGHTYVEILGGLILGAALA